MWCIDFKNREECIDFLSRVRLIIKNGEIARKLSRQPR